MRTRGKQITSAEFPLGKLYCSENKVCIGYVLPLPHMISEYGAVKESPSYCPATCCTVLSGKMVILGTPDKGVRHTLSPGDSTWLKKKIYIFSYGNTESGPLTN